MPRGPMGGRRAVEEPHDFGKVMGKLVNYCRNYLPVIIIALILGAAGTVCQIVGPDKLKDMTNEIVKGLPAIVNGRPVMNSVDFGTVGHIAWTLVALYVGYAVLGYVQSWMMANVTQRTAQRLRESISVKINKLPLKYFDKVSYGDVLSRITNDVDAIGQTLGQSLGSLITSVTLFVGALVMMFYNNVIMTLCAIGASLIGLIIMMAIMKSSQKYFARQQMALGDVNGHVEEMYAGHLIVKAYNGEADSIRRFEKYNSDLYESGWKSQFLSGLMMPLMNFVGNLGYVGICILGGFLSLNGTITVGDIQAFIQYVKNFTQPITQIAQVSNMLQSAAAAAERVFEFLDEEEEEQTVEHPVSMDHLTGAVSFEHVRFGYTPDKIVIQDFSCEVKPGQMVAIVGPTGAGKTTMIKLLMRFYDVNSGAIKIDGHDVRDFNRSELREMFGMVLQDTWLFNGSIRDNIKYGKLDATDEEIYAAAKLAHADQFIQMLPKGYDTMLSGDGEELSQGQRQLLSIARAAVADPPVLILDEATSSIDTRTEKLVQDGMDKLMHGRTTFVIAHRLSTVRNSDCIMVLENGRIIERGTHDQLIEEKGKYYQLYTGNTGELA